MIGNQFPILARCRCGWEGTVPNQLVLNMGTQTLDCPRCFSQFRALSQQNVYAGSYEGDKPMPAALGLCDLHKR